MACSRANFIFYQNVFLYLKIFSLLSNEIQCETARVMGSVKFHARLKYSSCLFRPSFTFTGISLFSSFSALVVVTTCVLILTSSLYDVVVQILFRQEHQTIACLCRQSSIKNILQVFRGGTYNGTRLTKLHFIFLTLYMQALIFLAILVLPEDACYQPKQKGIKQRNVITYCNY